MSWIDAHLVTEKTRGFIYLIVNTLHNKFYIGKKKAISETRVTVAGRTNKKRVVKPSNWKSYYGSSKELQADIKKYGVNHFHRYVLEAYDELHSVNYAEADIQFMLDVLKSDEFYNKNIKITTMRYPTSTAYRKKVHTIIKKYKKD